MSALERVLGEHRYIVVEGPIGVGKSSLTNILAERVRARRVMEVVEENPFLSSFYADKAKFAFQTQMFFLLSRFKQQQELFQQDLFSAVTVSDFSSIRTILFNRVRSITIPPYRGMTPPCVPLPPP